MKTLRIFFIKLVEYAIVIVTVFSTIFFVYQLINAKAEYARYGGMCTWNNLWGSHSSWSCSFGEYLWRHLTINPFADSPKFLPEGLLLIVVCVGIAIIVHTLISSVKNSKKLVNK